MQACTMTATRDLPPFPMTDPHFPPLDAFRRSGDREALARLFTAIAPAAALLARRRLGDAAEADDAVQEACLDAIAACHAFRPERGTVRGWLLTLVLNRCRMHERARQRRRRHEAAAPPPAPSLPPDRDLVETVQDAVRDLPEHERAAVELRFFASLSPAEVAAALGRKEKTVRSQLDRALDRLRGLLARRGMSGLDAAALGAALAVAVPATSTALAGRLAECAATAAAPTAVAAGGTFATGLGLACGGLLVAVALGIAVRSGPEERTDAQPPAPLPGATVPADPPAPSGPRLDAAVRVIGASSFQAPGPIARLAFAPDGRRLAAATREGVVVWDVPAGTVVHRLARGRMIDLVAWRDDGRLCWLESMGMERSLVVWELAAERESLRLAMRFADAREIHLDPTRRWLTVPAHREPVLPPATPRRRAQTRTGVNTGVAVVDLDAASQVVVAEDVVRRRDGFVFRVAGGMRSPDGSRIAFVDTHSGWSDAAADTSIRLPLRLGILDATGSVIASWELPGTSDASGMQLRWTAADALELTLPSAAKRTAATHRLRIGDAHPVVETRCALTTASGAVAAWFDGQGLQPVHEGAAPLTAPEGWNASCAVVSDDGRWSALHDMRAQAAVADLRRGVWVSPDPAALSAPPSSMVWTDDDRLALGTGTGVLLFDVQGAAGRLVDPVQRIDVALPTSGRLFLTAGDASGRPVPWDLATGRRLAPLPAAAGVVTGLTVSPSGRWVLADSEDAGRMEIIDRTTGRRTGGVSGPEHPFFGRRLHVQTAAWSADEASFYLADTTAAWFHREDRRQAGLTAPIALSGAWDPATGTQRWHFSDGNGGVVESVGEIAPAPDGATLYLRPGAWWAADAMQPSGEALREMPPGLWSAQDGRRLRPLPDPGTDAGFSPDGTLVVGSAAAVRVADSAVVARWPSHLGLLVPSPSRTWIAAVAPGPVVRLIEPRSGRVRWTVAAQAGAIAAARPVRVAWSAGEDRLAIAFADHPAVAWIDLYPAQPAATDPAAAAAAVQTAEGEAPVLETLALIASGAPAVAALGEVRSTGAVLVLERLAAAGDRPAAEALMRAAAAGSGAAADALARGARAAAARTRWAQAPVSADAVPALPGATGF